MCLTIYKDFKSLNEAKKFKRKPLIAKKDIRVYKVLTINNTSPYKGMKYKKGFHYTEKQPFKGQVFYDSIEIETGLHSCNIKVAEKIKWHDPFYRKIVTMYIPKGSLFFKGSNGDYVSDQLVWY